MHPLADLLELHVSTDGWSTAALVAVISSLLLVGRIVMLRDARRTWIGNHPVATGILATVAIVILGKSLEAITEPLFGVGWVGLSAAVLLTAGGLEALHTLEMTRRRP